MGILSSFKFVCTFVDIFGQSIQLRINKQTKSKTLFGGILSILMFLLLFAFFYYNAQDVIYKTNPQISIEQQINTNFSAINLDKNSFPMSFALTNYGNYPVHLPRYFTYSIVLNYGLTTEENLKEIKLNWTNCTKDFFPLISEYEYEKLQINNYFCIENQNLTLSGSWNTDYIKFLKLSVMLCHDREDCASNEEILEFIRKNKLYWNLYFQNTYINPQNSDFPISYNLVNYYKSLRVDSSKIIEVYIRKEKLDSEEGFLLQSKQIHESLSYDYDIFDDGSLDDSQTLVEFSVQVSSNNLIYHRAYMKIQSAIANVGGLSTVLRITFLVVSYIFSVVSRNEIILNSIIEFDLKSTNKIIENKNQSSLKEIFDDKIIIFSNSKFKDSKANITDTCLNLNEIRINKKIIFKNKQKGLADYNNSILRKIENKNSKSKNDFVNKKNLLNKTEQKSLSFSFIEIISAFLLCGFCRSNYIKNKRKLYDKAYKSVENFFDFTYIIQNINETEKLKLALLEPHQIALFNNTSKELISLDEDKMKNHEMTKQRNFYKNEENLSKLIHDYYEKINNNQGEVFQNEIDNKLMRLLKSIN
jgi:hypothetical protein